MKNMTATKFKAQCLSVMDTAIRTGEPVVITKHGKPVVKLVPAERDNIDDIFGYMAGKVKIVGDIESPVVPPEEWNASRSFSTLVPYLRKNRFAARP